MKRSSLLCDGMVLQRNENVIISGTAAPLQDVHLSFLDVVYKTVSNQVGNWSVQLPKLKPGGPYVMEILTDTDKVLIQDVLIGDVWVLGGQSNMELPIRRTLDLFDDEVKHINEPHIRQFSVPQTYNFHEPQQELDRGKWMSATNDNVLDFSAVGYFFAKTIYEKYQVPIGLIQTAVGGTPIEAWISEETLREIGGYDHELDRLKDDSYVATTKRQEEKNTAEWHQALHYKDKGIKEKWYHDSYSPDNWDTFDVPNTWEESELEPIRGSIWFRRDFDLPPSITNDDAKLKLGTIIDADETYINGTKIGTTGYRYPPRRYDVPAGVLRPGRNSITVRIISTESTGGFIKDMPYTLVMNGNEVDLQGTWKYKIGAITEPQPPSTFFQYKPAGVFNSMIAPIGHYQVKGFLWYQGESNTGKPDGYHHLFAEMVKNWRKNWGQGELPFLFTQLTNWDTGEKDPTNSGWALLREEQRLSLQTSNTAMAVTIDVGEHNDLHPQDKKTVGARLALCALNKAYGEDITYSGPLFTEMKRMKDQIQLSFTHIGSGLIAKGGELKGFTIRGEEGTFLPAHATIKNDTIIVKNDKVKEPQHVRYAWVANPQEANLYNKEGLPASPFTTET